MKARKPYDRPTIEGTYGCTTAVGTFISASAVLIVHGFDDADLATSEAARDFIRRLRGISQQIETVRELIEGRLQGKPIVPGSFENN